MIHQDITRARLEHGATNLQDAYRIAWMNGIPPELRKPGNPGAACLGSAERGALGGAVKADRAKARYAAWAKLVMPLHDAGKSVPEIARVVPIDLHTIRRVIREQGQAPNKAAPPKRRDYSPLLPKAHEMREKGVSWVAISKALGVSKTAISEAYAKWRRA